MKTLYLKWLFVSHAMRMLTIPYIWAGNNPIEGMDCSGFAQELWAAFGVDPVGDQTAHQLYRHFLRERNGEEIFPTTAPIGAGVFFGSEEKITHVGVSLGFGYMIEAGGGDSKTTTRELAGKRGAFIRIRPIQRRKDLHSIIMPKLLPWA